MKPSVESDPLLLRIGERLRAVHGCHAAILYGSRARGEATDTSDYDVLGARDSGPSLRDAELLDGKYLDAFVHPRQKLERPDATLLHIRNGIVLFEQDGLGTRFLAALDALFERGPSPLPADEIQALRVWARKSLERVRAGGILGNLRRMELVPRLLEDWFTTRGRWYLGPKASLRWMAENMPELHAAFEAALHPSAPIEAIERLVQLTEY
ncbi:MAG: nucleotidyltransferase domain-containing protein [Deltaproteobacteria bacterium]|nr:nucleotidyltransferase domain-containing protein [Deltaproteobacteria bacterium]